MRHYVLHGVALIRSENRSELECDILRFGEAVCDLEPRACLGGNGLGFGAQPSG